jgi:hypothetical protein
MERVRFKSLPEHFTANKLVSRCCDNWIWTSEQCRCAFYWNPYEFSFLPANNEKFYSIALLIKI